MHGYGGSSIWILYNYPFSVSFVPCCPICLRNFWWNLVAVHTVYCTSVHRYTFLLSLHLLILILGWSSWWVGVIVLRLLIYQVQWDLHDSPWLSVCTVLMVTLVQLLGVTCNCCAFRQVMWFFGIPVLFQPISYVPFPHSSMAPVIISSTYESASVQQLSRIIKIVVWSCEQSVFSNWVTQCTVLWPTCVRLSHSLSPDISIPHDVQMVSLNSEIH